MFYIRRGIVLGLFLRITGIFQPQHIVVFIGKYKRRWVKCSLHGPDRREGILRLDVERLSEQG